MEEVRVAGEIHIVYTKAEAVEGDIKYVQWRDGEEGSWIETDDGYVLQVLRSGKLRQNQRWVRTAIGTYSTHPGAVCDTNERRSRYTFSGDPSIPKRMTRKLRMFCNLYAMTGDAVQSYKKAYPDARSEDYIENRLARLAQSEMVMSEVDKRVRAVATKLGLNEKWVMERFMAIADAGEKDNDRLRALESLVKIMKMVNEGGMSKKIKVEQTIPGGFSKDDLKEMEGQVKIKKELTYTE